MVLCRRTGKRPMLLPFLERVIRHCHVILDQLVLRHMCAIKNSQHGFLKGRPCLTNLLEFFRSCIKLIKGIL